MSFPDLASIATQINPQKQQPPGPNDPGGPPPDPQTLQSQSQPPQIDPVQASPPPGPADLGPPPGQDQGGYSGLYNQAPPGFGEDGDYGTPEEYRASYERMSRQGPISMLHPDMYERMYRGRRQRDVHQYITGPGPWRTQHEQPSQYIPAAKREHGEWGRPWWPIEAGMSLANIVGSPYMPSPYEAYNVIRESGRQLGIYASPGVGQPAARASNFAMGFAPILDALSNGAFTKNFNAARMNTMKIQREQMLLDAEISQQQHQEQLLAFGRIFELAKIGAISMDDARQQVRNLAIQTGHQFLIGVLNNKDLGGVEEYLNWEDQKMRDMWASTTSLRKATGGTESEAEAARLLGREPHAGGAGSSLPTKQGYSQEQTKTAQADTGTMTDAGPANEFTGNLQKKMGLTQEELDMAEAIAEGKPSASYEQLKKIKGPGAQQGLGRVNQAADAIRKRVADTLNNKNLSQDKKLEELEALGETDTASTLRGLLELRTDPEKDIPAAKGERKRLTTMASQINPHWRTSSFALAKQYEQLNQGAVKAVGRVSSFTHAVNELNAALQDAGIDPDKPIPANILQKVYDEKWGGNPAYPRIYAAIQNILNETSAIQSGTGTSRITGVKMRAEEFLNTMSPAQIRSVLLTDAAATYGYVRSISDQFKKTVGDPNAQLPFFSRQVQEDFRSVMRSNPYTGEMPADASGAVLASSSKIEPKSSAWYNGDKNSPDYQGWKPYTMDEVYAARKLVRENEKSTDPKVQAQVQYLRKRLGTGFATAEPGDKDYDEQERHYHPDNPYPR